MKKKVSRILALIVAMGSLSSLPACARMQAGENEQSHLEEHKVVVTSPLAKDVVITQPYVCQIRSRKNIEVCALTDGYIEEIHVKEGQAVQKDEVMYKILPTLYNAKYAAEKAKAELARIKWENTNALYENKSVRVVSYQEVLMAKAELDEANAKAHLAAAEVNFTIIRAPFDGIVDRLNKREGSLIKREDVLTTLSDNHVMWVYFNVPEARYLEYMTGMGPLPKDRRIEIPDSKIELVLANGSKFKHTPDKFVTVEGQFNNETGNIAFRADFPNPDGLLRHGQTGTVVIHRSVKNAIVIPQRATFEILDKRYVWLVGEDHVAHQHPIAIEHELEDIYVIKGGLGLKDKIVLDGVRQVREGQKLEDHEFQKPEEALAQQKHHAE
jgi:membrane fusion protein (multidrug efflux system)